MARALAALSRDIALTFVRHGVRSNVVQPGTVEAVRFLAGDASRWITGVVLPVDGEWLAAAPSSPPR